VARLLAVWRALGMPVYHVRHDSTEADSTYRPGQAGARLQGGKSRPYRVEVVIAKPDQQRFQSGQAWKRSYAPRV